ncbi:MAG TPA: pirin family protein [Thermoanaerobaculia bacterium]|jgi:redox-sensitive bicupin YhaK (pirin superfamily)
MRAVRDIHDAIQDDIGDLRTQRALPAGKIDMIDPFLLLNHHGPQVYPPGNRGLPFGPHPHRGFETVTFIVDGSLSHSDTGGHESAISAGGVQWMTAGRGVEHSELSPVEFLEHGGPLEILQLWINLPARLKMTEPHYVGLQKPEIPSITIDDGRVTINLISGQWNGQSGPIQSLTGVVMMTVSPSAGGRIVLSAPRGRNVFLYIVRGEVRVSGTTAREFQLVELEDDGDDVALEAFRDSLVIFGHAAPLNEPVVARGPFVMNTQQEIVEAARDYYDGKFR